MGPYDVCECGDYRKSHTGGIGPCGYCANSRAPYDNCARFRFAYHGDPIALIRTETGEGDQAMDQAPTEASAPCAPCASGNHDYCYFWERRRWWSPCNCKHEFHVGKPTPVVG